MSELMGLWLPIIICAIVVFIASFICWTVSPHHKPDWAAAPGEDQLLKVVRDSIPSGQYMFPYCADWSDLKDPDKKARYEAGPHGTLTVWSGTPNMGQNMALTMLFFLVASFFVAYLCTVALEPGASFSKVFQVAGTAAILAYCFAFIPNSIWFRRKARTIVADVFDGVIYGLITAAIFGWLWPR